MPRLHPMPSKAGHRPGEGAKETVMSATNVDRGQTAAIRHRTATVLGRQVSYREAGDPTAPTLLLLHGLPTSGRMFNPLIPLLADRFHVIAPDYIGFGHSEAPKREDFAYTFDNLAAHVAGLVDVLELSAYTLYMQDYGGPIGFRLFQQRPEQVKGFIIQNAKPTWTAWATRPRRCSGRCGKRARRRAKPPRASSSPWPARSGTGWSA